MGERSASVSCMQSPPAGAKASGNSPIPKVLHAEAPQSDAQPSQAVAMEEREANTFNIDAPAQVLGPQRSKRFYLYTQHSQAPIRNDDSIPTPLPTILGVKPEPWLIAHSTSIKQMQPPQETPETRKHTTPTEEELRGRAEH